MSNNLGMQILLILLGGLVSAIQAALIELKTEEKIHKNNNR